MKADGRHRAVDGVGRAGPAALARLSSLPLVLAALVMLGACTTRGGMGGSMPPSMGDMEFSGAPELVGTATLPGLAGGHPAALATAAVLNALGWPVESIDTTGGTLVSQWEYFEPAIRNSAGDSFCRDGMALRFSVRPTSGRRAELVAEAFLPRSSPGGDWSARPRAAEESARRDALGHARATLASLRKTVLGTGGKPEEQMRAVEELRRELNNGRYRRCDNPVR